MQKQSSSLYSNLILYLFIVYELNNCLCNPSNNFPIKNCLFGTAKLAKNAMESELIHNDWVILFDGEGSWGFGNGFANNVVIFGVHHSLSSHTNNSKNDILVLGERPTDGINDNTSVAEKTKDKLLFKLLLQWWWELLVCK